MPTDRKAPAAPTSNTTAVDATPVPAKGGRKKLIIIAAAVAVVLLLVGGGAVFMLKKKAAAEAEGDEAAHAEGAPAAGAKHAEKGGAPVFVPLDQFTVNLADREAERFAQVGVTLEMEDAKAGDKVKSYMPAIRNNILLAIADKTAAQLLDREGKRRLASEIRRETLRVLGVDIPADDDAAGDGSKQAKAKKKATDEALPVRAVHFSNFIIQ